MRGARQSRMDWGAYGCGRITTGEYYLLDAVTLIERGDTLAAGLYVGGSVGLSIIGLFLGLYLVRALT